MPTRTRSVTVWSEGDVYSPTRIPAAERIDAIIAAVLPLPFVPAT